MQRPPCLGIFGQNWPFLKKNWAKRPIFVFLKKWHEDERTNWCLLKTELVFFEDVRRSLENLFQTMRDAPRVKIIFVSVFGQI